MNSMKYSQSGFVYIIVIIILAVSIAVGGVYYTKVKQEKIESDSITSTSSPNETQVTKKEVSPTVTTDTSVTVAVANTVPHVDVKEDPVMRWLYERRPAGEEFVTKVTLEIDGKKYDAGIYSGGCHDLDKNQLIGNQISAVVCAYGGVNDELSVVKMADGKLSLMHTSVSGDMSGTKAKITSRFDSKILLRID